MSPLVVESITKKFGIVVALQNVSLEIPQGKFVAIMGASGSGKSTLLHLMAGLTPPDSGRVLINGTDIGKLSDRELTLFRRHQIGLVFQAFNLIPTLSAEENIRLPLMLEKMNRDESSAKVESLLSHLGLSDRRAHRPDALSGGEQQRVAIGRALIANPAVILADEPTGNLDSANSKSICELLQSLARDTGRTIVMVTHEPAVAAFAQTIIVFRDGRLVQQFDTNRAGPDELAARYQQALRA